jgi:Response regulator containing CheY-like receiver and SARP domains
MEENHPCGSCVFFAKLQQIRGERAEQMAEILAQGYKSADLYSRKGKQSDVIQQEGNRMMIRAVLIDDEVMATDLLRRLLEKRGDVEVVGAFNNTAELLEAMPGLSVDAAFVDVEMPGMNGLKLAEALRNINDDIEIIFVTAHQQYALDAFRVHASNYLLKPLRSDLLDEAVNRIRRRMGRRPEVPVKRDIRVRCFGGFTVSGTAEGSLVRFPTLKAEELFAYFLVHRNRPVPKWGICESLWPDHMPDKASQNLHTTIFRMKKTLQEHGVRMELESARGYYRFALLEPCDYIQFAVLAGQDPASAFDDGRLEDALWLYGGGLFDGKDYHWCGAEKELMETTYAGLAKRLASRWIAAGKHDRALDLLRQAAFHVPFDENVHESVLRIHFERKDRTSFFAHYRKMEELLRRELGIAPSAEIRQLYGRMIEEG